MLAVVSAPTSPKIALDDLTTAHINQLICMKNTQFGNPLPRARVAEILVDAIAPGPSDYEQVMRLLA